MKLSSIRQLSLLGILILVVTIACRSGAPSGGSGSGDNLTVNVVALEFKFTLDTSQARPGTITFVVRNDGHMQHDFAIDGNGVDEKTPMIDPGETATLEVTLESGSYSYAYTVPGHAAMGMRGTFTVAP